MVTSKKIKFLINIINLDANGIQIPWLVKFKKLESHGMRLFVNSGVFLKEISLKSKDVYSFNQSITKIFDNISTKKLSKFGYINYVLKKNIKSYKSLRKLQKQNFKVVYSPSSVLDLIIVPYLLKRRCPSLIWVSVFDNTVPLKGPGSKIVRFLAWFFYGISLKMLRRADRIFTVTPELQKNLISRGFSQEKIILTGNAVETDLILKAQSDKKIKIDALFMGRINEKKGIYDLLEVLKIVVKKIPDFQLGILGEGDKPTEEAFKLKINKMELTENIILFGYKNGIEKYALIKSAKVFWFMSHDESFGVALLEAVCCGKPALVYRLSPYAEIYQQNEIKQFDFGAYRAIAKETWRIFKTKNFQNKAGEKLLKKYNWDKIITTEVKSFRYLIKK